MMAPALFIYTLYQVAHPTAGRHTLLLRTTRPAFTNASQADEDRAEQQEEQQQSRLLAAYRARLAGAHSAADCTVTLLGICGGEPPGDSLYEDHGAVTLALWVAQTRFGYPWVVLGVAPTEDAFFAEVASNALYASYAPRRPARSMLAYFLTEADLQGVGPLGARS